MSIVDPDVPGATNTDADPLDVVRAYERRVAQIAERASQTQAELAAVQPSATSAHGEVTVKVSASGGLVAIDFGQSARDLELRDLSALIMRTVGTARVQAAQQTQAAMSGLLGSDSKAMSFLQSQVPELVQPPAAAAESRVEYDDEDERGYTR